MIFMKLVTGLSTNSTTLLTHSITLSTHATVLSAYATAVSLQATTDCMKESLVNIERNLTVVQPIHASCPASKRQHLLLAVSLGLFLF